MIINASPLIIFGKLCKLDILIKIYTNIEIPNEVYQEVVINGINKNSRDALIVKEHIDNNKVDIVNIGLHLFLSISKQIFPF